MTPEPPVPKIQVGRDFKVGDVPGQFAVGEHIYQINLIYNDYSSSLKQGKLEDIPTKLREQLENHLSKIKEAESDGVKLSTDAFYTLGLSAYFERNFDVAEKYLKNAVDASPDNLMARNLLCTIYATRSLDNLSKKDYKAVIDDSTKAESYFQYQPIAESLIIMGYVYKNMFYASKDRAYLEKAKEKFEIALALEDPRDVNNIAGARNGLGNYYWQIGNTDEAVKMYLEAIKTLPQYASAHHDLALVYEAKMGESGSDINEWRLKAIEEWKKALYFGKTDPNFSPEDITRIEKRIRDL